MIFNAYVRLPPHRMHVSGFGQGCEHRCLLDDNNLFKTPFVVTYRPGIPTVEHLNLLTGPDLERRRTRFSLDMNIHGFPQSTPCPQAQIRISDHQNPIKTFGIT